MPETLPYDNKIQYSTNKNLEINSMCKSLTKSTHSKYFFANNKQWHTMNTIC